MPNFEKQFIDKILDKHPEAETCLYYLLENNLMSFDRMKYYIIRERWKQMKQETQPFLKMQAYADIAEEFSISFETARHIVNYHCG